MSKNKGSLITTKSRASSSGPTKNGVKLIVYCPHCKQEVDPRFTPHVSVSEKSKTAKCPHGHVFEVRH